MLQTGFSSVGFILFLSTNVFERERLDSVKHEHKEVPDTHSNKFYQALTTNHSAMGFISCTIISYNLSIHNVDNVLHFRHSCKLESFVTTVEISYILTGQEGGDGASQLTVSRILPKWVLASRISCALDACANGSTLSIITFTLPDSISGHTFFTTSCTISPFFSVTLPRNPAPTHPFNSSSESRKQDTSYSQSQKCTNEGPKCGS